MPLFREHKKALAVGTIIDYITIKPGELALPLKVRRIAAWNDTHAATVFVEVGLENEYNRYPLARDATPLAQHKIVSYDEPFILPADVGLYAAFNVATASDVIHMFVMGELQCFLTEA